MTRAIAIVLLLAAPAAAQEPTDGELALARELHAQGMEAAEQQRWEEARLLFQRAFEIAGRPLLLLNVATAQVQSGMLVEGSESYRRFLALAESDPDARAFIRDTRRELVELTERVPRVRILVQNLDEADEVTLDTRPLAHASLGAPLPVNPGEHDVVVMRQRRRVFHGGFSLEERESIDLPVDLPLVTPPGPGPLDLEPEEPEVDEGGGGVSPWVWVAVGAVLIAAVLSGVLLGRSSGDDPLMGNLGRWEVR